MYFFFHILRLYFDVQFLREKKKDRQDSSFKHETFFFLDIKDITRISGFIVQLPLPDIAGSTLRTQRI